MAVGVGMTVMIPLNLVKGGCQTGNAIVVSLTSQEMLCILSMG